MTDMTDIQKAYFDKVQFAEGWNWFVSGRRRATATDNFWKGYKAAELAGADSEMPYPAMEAFIRSNDPVPAAA